MEKEGNGLVSVLLFVATICGLAFADHRGEVHVLQTGERSGFGYMGGHVGGHIGGLVNGLFAKANIR